MKAVVATLTLSVAFVVVSEGFAQNSSAASKAKRRENAYAEIAQAPEKARAKRNPLESDPEAVAAGRILFEQHCSACHGNAAEGGRKGPSLRAEEIQNATPGAVFWVLTNGVVRRGMPVWSKLPEPQRWQIVAYLKSLGVVPFAPQVPPPSAAAR